ncbi:hypothetical protein ACTWQL_18775 [Pseudalkalibacillus sp. R45]|uniref:hypothetical protein n=1 Tax=Pseudalkalibacillus sp. R45 TaxID=3457433 RepID=UPI003FCC8143
MPCEEIIQVVGTLIPQDKESFGSVTSHEQNAIFIFEESRTLLSNQLAQSEFFKMTQKHQSIRDEPKSKRHPLKECLFLCFILKHRQNIINEEI